MKSPRASTILASEIGSYLFCQRAWWYQQKGEVSENTAEMISGTEIHEQHGRVVITAGLLRWAAYSALMAALILSVVYLVNLLV